MDHIQAESPKSGRVLQLVIGLLCMVMIANLQYGWNLFVNPINEQHHWGRAAIQVAFSIFVLTETWLVPVEGWFVDKFGPRIIVAVGGLLVGAAWVMNAMAGSLFTLYLAATLSGIGAGSVYGTCVGNALKWFVGRRGLAAGITAAGFGAGAAATVLPIHTVIETHGYQTAFFWFGLGQGGIILLLSSFLKAPAAGIEPIATTPNIQARHSSTPLEVLKSPVFWLLYLMFILVAAGGLIVTAQLASMAIDFGIAKSPLTVLGISGTVLTIALVVDNVLNGLARPFFGWISDRIGREATMFIAFTLAAVAIGSLARYGRDPVLFVITSGLIYFTWGEIYSLFPATCTDAYGHRYATTNAGMLYTAKGTASLLVPLSSLMSGNGDWHAVLWVGAAGNLAAALLAILVLRPMRMAHAKQCSNTTVLQAGAMEQN
ncbi:MAG TPA: oxalate/formate MFS antiporter [Rhizomicrobium sp.]|jgi:OFA family oxalate/formate antiporter-like MFS transporter